MVEIEFQPKSILQVAVCKYSDPILEFLCERRGIKVWKKPT